MNLHTTSSIRSISTRLAGGLLLAATVVGLPAVAGAATRPVPTVTSVPSPASARVDLTTVAQKCTAAIDRRFTTIDQLANATTAADTLSDAHRSALQAELGAARSGLQGLRAQITAATDLATLKSLCPLIVEDYRVYVLEAPTVHLSIAADREVAAAGHLDQIGTKLDAAITRAEAAGHDVGQARTFYADFTAKVSEAKGLGTGVPGAVIPLTPAGYNDGSAVPVLASSRDALVKGKGDLVAARDDATKIVAILKALA
ncbi:MAG TPA: hypothetical protein VIJ47_12585 [Acidimicrobiales bacterium]